MAPGAAPGRCARGPPGGTTAAIIMARVASCPGGLSVPPRRALLAAASENRGGAGAFEPVVTRPLRLVRGGGAWHGGLARARARAYGGAKLHAGLWMGGRVCQRGGANGRGLVVWAVVEPPPARDAPGARERREGGDDHAGVSG